MEWHQVFDKIQDHIVKIITPKDCGTGFLIGASNNNKMKCVATAAHVTNYAEQRRLPIRIQHTIHAIREKEIFLDYKAMERGDIRLTAEQWNRPIRIQHAIREKESFLEHKDRAILSDQNKDTSLVFFENVELELPDDPLPLITEDRYVRVGVDVGWIGFPAISPANLCFFNGRISSWIEKEEEAYYLVNGVAIKGVSGGPAFNQTGGILGLVTNYIHIHNQTDGISMPGLCVIRDISHARETAEKFKSVSEAQKKKES